MAWTQTQLDTLEAAIAQGVLTVEYGDKRVTYQSMADMLRLREKMIAELRPGSTSNVRGVRLTYSPDA